MTRLSDAMLKHVYAATGARAVTRVERVQELWSGYGEIARLWLSGGKHASVIVKLVQPTAAARPEDRRSHARKLRSYAVERSFYERYSSRCTDSCRVAHMLACESLAGQGQWLFVLEDLDAAGFRQRRDHLPQHAVRAGLDWLAHFHATFMGECPAELWAVGTYWHLDTRPDELARSGDQQLVAAASWLDARLHGAKFRTLVHGDAKVENFCFSDDLANVAAVDFQYTGAGCGVQDVAYFLGSCLRDRDCEAQADALLDALLDNYFEILGRALVQRRSDVDASALEAEWRELYPIAWADFARFMSGWAPAYDTRSGYAGRMTHLALEAFAAESIAQKFGLKRPR